MKQIWKAFIIISLAMLLAACSIQTVEQYESMREEERSVQLQETPAPDKAEQGGSEAAQGEAVNNNESAEPVAPTPSETEKVDTQAEPEQSNPPNKTTVPPTEQSESTGKGQQETAKPTVTVKPTVTANPTATTKPAVTPAPSAKPVEQETAQPKKRYVTIAIHTETLLDNWDKLDKSLQDEKYVPKDGVILSATKYELLSDKETVWDVLLRATKEHKIQLEYQGASSNIYNSVYVEGINHLYEFSAGSLSGWMYQVNGVYPNYGCDQYKLEDGDVIEWHYTVDLGRDLGTGV